jgi:putative hydrolase of the HAD superfamily
MGFEALVFDFFGVVCAEVSVGWFREHGLRDKKEHYDYLADVGEEPQEALFDELAKLSGVPSAEIELDWNRRASLDTELLALIGELHREYKIGLLSNAPSPFFRGILARGGIGSYFDAVVVSSEIRHVKPEPEAFHAVLEKLGVAPEKALMIDDNERNVEGAIKAGMAGYHFTSLAGLKQRLGRV